MSLVALCGLWCCCCSLLTYTIALFAALLPISTISNIASPTVWWRSMHSPNARHGQPPLTPVIMTQPPPAQGSQRATQEVLGNSSTVDGSSGFPLRRNADHPANCSGDSHLHWWALFNSTSTIATLLPLLKVLTCYTQMAQLLLLFLLQSIF